MSNYIDKIRKDSVDYAIQDSSSSHVYDIDSANFEEIPSSVLNKVKKGDILVSHDNFIGVAIVEDVFEESEIYIQTLKYDEVCSISYVYHEGQWSHSHTSSTSLLGITHSYSVNEDMDDLSATTLNRLKLGDTIFSSGTGATGIVTYRSDNSMLIMTLEEAKSVEYSYESDGQAWNLDTQIEFPYGTKLYKHTLTFDTDLDQAQVIQIISTTSDKYSLVSLKSGLNNIVGVSNDFQYDGDVISPFKLLLSGTNLDIIGYSLGHGAVECANLAVVVSDTVTPL